MDIYNELSNLIDSAVKINRENRLRFNDMQKQMGPVQYAMQMCTVEINVGRAVGYSTYIKRKFDAVVGREIAIDEPSNFCIDLGSLVEMVLA